MASLRLYNPCKLFVKSALHSVIARDIQTKCASIFCNGIVIDRHAPGNSRQVTSVAASIMNKHSLFKPGQSIPGGYWFYTSVRYRKKIRHPFTKEIELDGVDVDTRIPSLDTSQLRPGYEDIAEIENAREEIKKIFTLEFGDGREKLKKRLDDLLEKIQEHPADVQTLEVLIAAQTLYIRNMYIHVLKFRKDMRNKALLKKRLNSRKHKLMRLREIDKERYDWLCNELGLSYTPPRSEWDDFKFSKRAARKKAARDGFLEQKKQKLLQLQGKLEDAKTKFEEFKEKELDELEEEMKALGVKDMSSMETVYEELGLGHMLYRPPKRIWRRRLLLQRKFEMYKDRAKQEVPT